MAVTEIEERSIGQILEDEFLKPYGLSQTELADALHIPRARVSDIVRGKRAISADTDLRLCHFFGLPEGYFLNIQNEFILQSAKQSLAETLKKIQPHQTKFAKTIILGEKDRAGNKAQLKLGIICGGPSLERGISLNSARSLLDHISQDSVKILPIYVDQQKNFYQISTAQLYSNTPSDFDFKLRHTAKKMNQQQLESHLKSLDIVFPVIHGPFGEDGELQALLEKYHVPYVGCGSHACRRMFHKFNAAKILKENHYFTLDSAVLRKEDPHNREIIHTFFKKHQLDRAIVKPIAGGSSIGVFSVTTPEETEQKLEQLFQMPLNDEAILEPFCRGKEFTVIVLQSLNGEPVALIPSEIHVSYDNNGIFDYRRKYLPTNNTQWLCPPHFGDTLVEAIQQQAESIFKLFGMRDFVRLDGWVLEDGEVLFSDINPISGMEQNSFIFQQSSRLGMTHRDLFWNLITNACRREHIKLVKREHVAQHDRAPVNVLFGGSTAERQVSLMSGSNVWLKLRRSSLFSPNPFLLDKHGHVWSLPYTYALNHTVEEVYENCLTASSMVERLEKFAQKIRARLGYSLRDYDFRKNIPQKISFEKFLENSKHDNAFLFLGLHGGAGEDGTIQQKLREIGISYNGSGPEASALCMDKYLTGQAVSKIGDASIVTAARKLFTLSQFDGFTATDYQKFWNTLVDELGSKTLIIKPQCDGCSAGVVRLYTAKDLARYVELVRVRATFIPAQTFTKQNNIIEMSLDPDTDYMIEQCIETDSIYIRNNELDYEPRTGWLELTVGVLEGSGVYYALNPSITIAEGEVLSLEEKFQGGTGVNITPPPESIIPIKMRDKMKRSIEKVAKALGIQNYARIDIFFNVKTEQLLVIEANTLPGLTPSTVIYHQALAEPESLPPIQFLERIIQLQSPSFRGLTAESNPCD